MCGVTGFWTSDGVNETALDVVRGMTAALRHRGPDDEGYWSEPATGVVLGHRRLSIIDLSPEGHQPMVSASGRYVIAYNGEIYNFLDLRRELADLGVRFRGRSDTEVMLAAVEQWGVLDAVRRFAGMFAFALYDRTERTLHLGRDRLGEKPLYHGRVGRTLVFGSELKALRAYPGWQGEINRDALALLLRYGYIGAPHTMYRGIAKVTPGTVLSFADNRTGVERPYWSADEVVERGLRTPLAGSDDDLLDELDVLLRRTVRREMIADVSLGAFLSGGVDSSLVVALMQAVSSRPVRTFTIGFREREYNEADHAQAVARRLGTEHTELYVTPADAQAVVPRLPLMYDEPLGDSSQIPTFLVSELARRHVTVSLSGDGGDELFGGYDRYRQGRSLWRWVRTVPRPARYAAARWLHAVPPSRWDAWLAPVGPALTRLAGLRVTGDRIHKLGDLLALDNAQALYRDLMSHWRDPAAVVLGGAEPSTPLATTNGHGSRPMMPLMMALDLVTYLPDDILVKVDRASMAISLESRAPFLDHDVVEFAWRLPPRLKVRRGRGKWALRQLLARYVPPSLSERPKMGFGVPIDHWLRGPLREWAGDLLHADRLRREGYLEPRIVQGRWAQHLEGSRNWQYSLWDILMFQAWLEAQ
jgi:asparagine synthase (glutamine-hydrolysing)